MSLTKHTRVRINAMALPTELRVWLWTTLHELNEYSSKGCWGNSMAGIEPSRGVWAMPYGQDYMPGVKPTKLG